jgi:Ran GTPase-activating protein (RanGAP) involved in mRNA processing and transport
MWSSLSCARSRRGPAPSAPREALNTCVAVAPPASAPAAPRLDTLPDALLAHVLALLPPDARARLACVNRALRAANAHLLMTTCCDWRAASVPLTATALAALLRRDGAFTRLDVRGRGDAAPVVAACLRSRDVLEVALCSGSLAWTPRQARAVLAACARLTLLEVDLELHSADAELALAWVLARSAPAALRVRRLRLGGAKDALPPTALRALIAALEPSCDDEANEPAGPSALVVSRASAAFAEAPGAAAALLRCCSARPGLEALSLEYCALDTTAVAQLASALAAMPPVATLHSLSLRGCGLGPPAAAALAAALPSASGLRSLDVRDNRLRDAGIASLAAALPRSSLRALRAGGNGCGADGARALAAALRCGCTLESLDLAGSRLCDDGGAALGDAIAFIGSASPMRALMLYNCSLGATSAAALAGALASGAPIASLRLGRNCLGDAGAAALATALACRPAPPLAELELSYNAIGADGCAALAHALSAEGGKLHMLALQINAGGDAGAAALAGALARPGCALKRLSLARNGVRDAGASALAASLAACAARAARRPCAAPPCRLEQLDVRGSDLGPTGRAALRRAAAACAGAVRLLGVPPAAPGEEDADAEPQQLSQDWGVLML